MSSSKDNRGPKSRLRLRSLQVLVLGLLVALWHVLTSPTLLPPIYFAEANQAAFFFGEPIQVFARLWRWFASGEIYEHLWVTLVETLLAFLIGTVSGVAIGLWLALSPTASAIFDPYIKAINAMPRVILAPIFPPVQARPDVQKDVKDLVGAIAQIPPDHIYGESLHVRGENLRLIQQDLKDDKFRVTPGLDKGMAKTFHAELKRVGLSGTWWYDH